jgi:hypothetical protein
MKLRNLLFIIVSMCFVILAACGKDESNENGDNSDLPKMVEVEIQVEPELNQIIPNETFTISAKVTQGEENVNDAEEVRFEFWKKGASDEEHEMIDGEFQADGIYSIEKMVEEPGVYYVISHVTARDMHTMPKKELVIGEVEEPSTEEESADGEQGNTEEDTDHSHGEGNEESSHDGDHASSGVMLHIMVDSTVEKNKEISLVGHIQQEEQPVSEAEVEFEVWKEGADKHDFIPADEGVLGEYTAKYTFAEAGDYHLKLHFVKDDLHDHNETVITVQ